jgi:hypothetical protein
MEALARDNAMEMTCLPTGTPFTDILYVDSYNGRGAQPYVLSQTTLNAMGEDSRVVLAGLSYHNIRDQFPENPPARVEHLYHLLLGLDNVVSHPVGIEPLTLEFRLEENYPNPFNPETTIEFSLARDSNVELAIYDATGAWVKTLAKGRRRADHYRELWDGKNESGRSVSSGVYFCRLTAGSFTSTRKMVLLR